MLTDNCRSAYRKVWYHISRY